MILFHVSEKMFGQSKNSKKYFLRNKFQTFNTNLENNSILILQK